MENQNVKQKQSGARIATRVLAIIGIVLSGIVFIGGLATLIPGIIMGATSSSSSSAAATAAGLVSLGIILLVCQFVNLALCIVSLVFSNVSHSFTAFLILGIITEVLTTPLNPLGLTLILTACFDTKKKQQQQVQSKPAKQTRK